MNTGSQHMYRHEASAERLLAWAINCPPYTCRYFFLSFFSSSSSSSVMTSTAAFVTLEWNFDDFNAEVDGVTDDEAEATRKCKGHDGEQDYERNFLH